MKAKYIGSADDAMLIPEKEYEILSVENGWFRIIDEEGDDESNPPGYLYPPELFTVTQA